MFHHVHTETICYVTACLFQFIYVSEVKLWLFKKKKHQMKKLQDLLKTEDMVD